MTMFLSNKTYKIVFRVNGQDLGYTARDVTEDDTFVNFVDKFGKKFTYNKTWIISVEEVSNGN